MDEYSHLDSFFDVLSSRGLWDSLRAEIRAIRQGSEDGGWLEGHQFEEAGHPQRILFDTYRTFAYSHIASVFQKLLLDRFQLPPITAWELTAIAKDQLSGASSDDEFEKASQRFCAFVGIATDYYSDDINISSLDIEVGDLTFGGTKIKKMVESCATIWQSQQGFRLAFSPRDSFGPLQVSIWAKISKGAMEAVSAIMSRVAPSASTTLHLVHCDPGARRSFGFVPYEIDNSKIEKDFELVDTGLFSSILTYYFLPPAKKTSSFEQRLRNAVHLLVEADGQQNKAIALSLCFSAIEALVCDKTDGIVDELSRHVAGLLEPVALKRPDAIRAIKQLYTLRSKALHGDALAEDEDARWRSRILAAAVLQGTIEWYRHITKLGDEPRRDDFLSELRTIATTGQQMIGVSPELSRLLPALAK